MAKSEHLQIRLTPEQKATLRRSADLAGQDLSSYVLDRILPSSRARFAELLRALEAEGESNYVLAELNDLLTELAPAELGNAVAEAPSSELSLFLRNYVAAMVELAADRSEIAPPSWLREIEPLKEPRFGSPLASHRAHLLRTAPVPFRRRNIFVDSSLGDRA